MAAPTSEHTTTGRQGAAASTPGDSTPTRAIVLLSLAGFASQAQVRVTDSLLPQIAADFGTSIGAAAVVVSAYVVAHGTIQLLIGPVGDRCGKYVTITAASAVAAVLVMLCGFAQTLTQLAATRFLAGAAAGWIIPLSMAFVGDVSSYERRQPVLARYLTGQIFGQLFGQAAGGVLGDLMGWRNVFFVLGGLFIVATAGLLVELWATPERRRGSRTAAGETGFVAAYAAVLGNGFARVVIVAVLIEAAFGWGAFAYVGADLHQRFGLGFTAVGLIVGTFALGGLVYAGTVAPLVRLFGQRGLAVGGALLCTLAYLVLAAGLSWQLAPVAVALIGLGFYALHNTLQTNATQMTPEARGTAVAVFSSAIYLGQTVGVALGALIFDRYTAVPLFLATAVALPLMALWFAHHLRNRARDIARGENGAADGANGRPG